MSKLRRTLFSMLGSTVALGIAASAAAAQSAHHPGISRPAPAAGNMQPGMMMEQGASSGQGMMEPDSRGMMDPQMMRMMMQMMDMGTGVGMRGQDKMGPDMMAPGSGKRVMPIQHLSTDDVHHFLEHSLEMRANPRLKVGEVEEVDEDTIVAEIVTVDDSLVERWRVDRHTGHMTPDNTTDEGPEN